MNHYIADENHGQYGSTYCACDHCTGYSEPTFGPPTRFTRRRMVRARKKYNAAARREPNACGVPIHWGTLDDEQQRWHALLTRRQP
jgi:hypothetical protein